MKAVDYLKAKARMTNNCKIDCDECPIDFDNNGVKKNCVKFESEHTEQAVEIISKWAKENPVKTYLNVLLEKLPNAKLNKKGLPLFCPKYVFPIENKCINDCVKCWHREYKEEK